MTQRELEHSVSGLMGAQYPPEYVKHHVDRLHIPGALRLLDLELSGPDESCPASPRAGRRPHRGLDEHPRRDGRRDAPACAATSSTTSRTRSWSRYQVALDCEPQVTGNHAMTKRAGEGGDQGRSTPAATSSPATTTRRWSSRPSGRTHGRGHDSGAGHPGWRIGRRRTSSRGSRVTVGRSAIRVPGQSRHCARGAGEAGKLGSR